MIWTLVANECSILRDVIVRSPFDPLAVQFAVCVNVFVWYPLHECVFY
jgi:hypothetical protein